jgi:hypothetical protein
VVGFQFSVLGPQDGGLALVDAEHDRAFVYHGPCGLGGAG